MITAGVVCNLLFCHHSFRNNKIAISLVNIGYGNEKFKTIFWLQQLTMGRGSQDVIYLINGFSHFLVSNIYTRFLIPTPDSFVMLIAETCIFHITFFDIIYFHVKSLLIIYIVKYIFGLFFCVFLDNNKFF